ncbi:type VI secretion system baseplate subunit TssE [Thioclava sp. FTW29]|uniref:Type VI secretion system baseplate subunit TssE n=1 Tax=Thioclava litoralis TaxID=3076557 RepID=A0ABZ1E5S5_9RHOB|nr:type VI secretion system baseplate subunit TssE [Thioclava sp. FTW29]
MAARDPAQPKSGFKHWNGHERAKISIFQVFRSAFEEHDARRANGPAQGGEVEVTQRSKPRREGVSADQLRRHLKSDLDALLNTIRLDAAQDLDDAPYVADSILNYGFRDLSSVSLAELQRQDLVQSIRESLLRHEPRLLAESLHVRVVEPDGNARQRLSISVEAEMAGDPVDIPVDFDAEVDLGSGNMKMSTLRVKA